MKALAPAALEGRRVLVVEDEALVAMELADVLERQGCRVIGPAASVAQALALLAERRLDAALLDLNLNGEPGLPVAVALSERGVPFVVVSGYSEDQASAPALRPAPRLTKPVRHRELVQVLTHVLTPPAD
jgi:CheY-like chemotaxis protein